MIGIEGAHDDELAMDYLEDIFAWLQQYPHAPLLVRNLQHDCMVAPPERGGQHWEIIRFDW